MSPRDERALWLARHVLPLELALRTWLARRPVPGLDVDDIVQETYAKLSNVDDVNAIRNVRSYLFAAAQSVVVSHLRRSQIVSISTFAALEFEVSDERPGPEQQLQSRDELHRLGEFIASMPPRLRQVLILRRVEGLPQREVAERLGVSEHTIEKQLAQAMMRLSQSFARGGKKRSKAYSSSHVSEQNNDAARTKPAD